MNKSEQINEIASALAKAQSQLRNPAFDSNNPHFKSKYASLASVRDTVIPVLSEHGLSVVQMPVTADGKAGCETMLMHSSGQFLSECLLITVDKSNAHGVGSAITYARRFSLMAFAGVVGDDDDDGNASVGKPKPSIVPAPITPTTGAFDGLAPDRAEVARRIGDAVIAMIEADSLEDAYTYLYVENKDAGRISNDEMIAVWSMLGPYSKARSAFKRMRDKHIKSEQSNNTTTTSEPEAA
jgi:hypothetical protein